LRWAKQGWCISMSTINNLGHAVSMKKTEGGKNEGVIRRTEFDRRVHERVVLSHDPRLDGDRMSAILG